MLHHTVGRQWPTYRVHRHGTNPPGFSTPIRFSYHPNYFYPPARSAAQMTACDRCGEHVSADYRRLYEVDGVLDGCPECLPRSVRWGDADPESVEDFDKDKHNNAKPFGGVKRKGTDDEAVPTR